MIFLFLIFFRAAEPPPQFQGVPQVTLEEGGKRLCITQKVKCKTKPTSMWYFLNKPIKHGGKYFLEISQDRDCYNIVCEVLNVSSVYPIQHYLYLSPITEHHIGSPKILTYHLHHNGKVIVNSSSGLCCRFTNSNKVYCLLFKLSTH